MTEQKVRVFVSYAHLDFEPMLSFDNSRAGEIYEMIRQRLYVGKEYCRFHFVRDTENFMQEGANVAGAIDAALDEADCALVFLSEPYVQSKWCRAEFLKLAKAGKHLFVIHLENVHALGGKHPEIDEVLEIVSQHKFTQFWAPDPKGDVDLLLGDPLPSRSDHDFDDVYKRARKFAKSMSAQAERLQLETTVKTMPTPSADAGARGAEHVRIFVAAPTSDAAELTDRLVNRIAEDGYEIVRADLSGDEATLDDRLATQMADCHFFIQMLGDALGRELGPDEEPQIVLQHRIARAVSDANEMKLICWRGGDVPVEELGRAFRTALQAFSLHEASFDSHQAYVMKVLAQEASKVNIDIGREMIGGPSVILDGDVSDAALIRELRDFMTEENAFVRILPPDGGPELQQDLADAAQNSDGAIVIYGKERDSQNRANSHFQILTRNILQADKPNLNIAALGNYASADALYPTGPIWEVLHLYDGFDADTVRDYLRTVRENMSA